MPSDRSRRRRAFFLTYSRGFLFVDPLFIPYIFCLLSVNDFDKSLQIL